MRPEWLQHHRDIERHYWWFVNKRRLVLGVLGRHHAPGTTLLDVGCGGGLFAATLAERGWRVIAADVSPAAAAFALDGGVTRAAAFSAGAGWPLADESVDAWTMLDVLEHVEHDATALREAYRVLRPGGLGVLTVPVHPSLFSPWDEYNQHFRRYTMSEITGRAVEAGFEIERRSYWNAISLPPAVLLRLAEKNRAVPPREFESFPKVPAVVNAGLRAYGTVEAAWARWLPVPFGLSALVVVRKR